MTRAGIPLPSLLTNIPRYFEPRYEEYTQLRRMMRLAWLDRLIHDLEAP